MYSRYSFKVNHTTSKLLMSLVSIALLLSIARLTAFTLKPFADELVSLTANTGFFINFDFRAGNNLLGGQGYSYSVLNSSGPFSAIGSTLTWLIYKDIYLARMFNFIFVLLLNTIISYSICNYFQLDKRYVIFSNLTIVTIPWWYGSLYSLGELPSVIVFFYAMVIFNKNRVLSVLLFSFSIFFSKLILLLFFGGFYLIYIFTDSYYHKKINLSKFTKDFLIFLLPLSLWLLLIHIYSDYGISQYFDDVVNYLILNHQSSDTSLFTNFSFSNIKMVIQNMKWSPVDIYKVLIFPIFTIFTLLKNKDFITRVLKFEVNSFIASISVFYFWFWILSTTKWIKYSSQMVYICLGAVLLIFFVTLSKKNRTQTILISISLLPFVSSLSVLFISSLLLAFSFSQKKYLINTWILIFILSGSNLLVETTLKDTFEVNMKDCTEQLLNDSCQEYYLGIKF